MKDERTTTQDYISGASEGFTERNWDIPAICRKCPTDTPDTCGLHYTTCEMAESEAEDELA